tara:strand:- start:940 stop:1155 length:216 start_codon:yes stop_codon:yes gene_type:complete
MFHFWHISAIVLVFFLGVVVGKELFWRRTSKQAMNYLLRDLSNQLKKNQLKIVKTNGEEKKFKDLLRDRVQ